MEQLSYEIRLHYTDKEINEVLGGKNAQGLPYSKHFNQNEEFFLAIEKDFSIPHLPIHHDVRNSTPTKEYLAQLRKAISAIAAMFPDVFDELTYFFDPGEILKPCFFRLYKVGESQYLYLLRIDLAFRPNEYEIINKGSNDQTPEYKTRHLFLEANFIPLQDIQVTDGKIQCFRIRQTISQTWIGETGRGYFVQGIWIDNDLTKFFTKLFLPKGKRVYPFYPFICKYKTICQTVVDLSPEGRRKSLPLLHKAIEFLSPQMETIQKSMRETPFSENLETFKTLKEQVPSAWEKVWETLTVEPYLNEKDMKEFKLEY